jgi:hypothetical protein
MSQTTTGFPARLPRIGSAASSLTPLGFARGYRAVHGVPGGANPARTRRRLAGEISRGGLNPPLDRRCDGFDPLPTANHVGILRIGADPGTIPEHMETNVEWRGIPRDRLERHMDRMTIQIVVTFEPAMIAAQPHAGIRTAANRASVHDRADNGETRHPGEPIGHSGRGARNSVSRRPDGRLLV